MFKHGLKTVIGCVVGLISITVCSNSLAESSSSKNNVETLSEVTIIGNTELPKVSFDLNWQLPTIEKREDQSPPKKVPGILEPLEPERHRQLLHFSKFLEIDSSGFKAK